MTTTEGARGGAPAPASGAALPQRPRTPWRGLGTAAVAERVAAGQINSTSARTSRTVLEIVRANVSTFFNGLVAGLRVVAVMTGRWQNATFGGVVVANAPADGVVLGSSGLAVDESLLTGEADAVAKDAGDEVWSGSIVVRARSATRRRRHRSRPTIRRGPGTR